jgi:bifunctional enzyme CysN/CysC
MLEELMNIVIVGHVDHGKSTIIGRLLADTHSLPEGKLAQVQANCERNAKPFEYAFLLDALKDEQAQGITIDIARCFFKTNKRKYLILDAPGHIEFLKNMITGASRAEAALLVIDANEGVKENSRRHAYMLSMLGIKQLVVLVNKMDLVGYSQVIFEKIVSEYNLFLQQIGLHPITFIPVSGMQGDSIAQLMGNLAWYRGKTVLQALDSFRKEEPLSKKPFRMPVQDVYRFTKDDDNRRIIAGQVNSGTLNIGDKVVFYPSGKQSRVKTIESFNKTPQKAIKAGHSAGFTLDEQIYIKRGEICVGADEEKVQITSKLRVSLFWLSKTPLTLKKEYLFKLGTAKVKMKVEKIINVMNAASLKKTKQPILVKRHKVAECLLKLHKPIAFDLAKDNAITSRFVIVDDYNIAGGGIVVKGLADKEAKIRKKVQDRNANWITSEISREERSEKYQQKPAVIIITGKSGSGRKTLAKALEKRFFDEGKIVYFLGIGNIVHGVDSDIKNTGKISQKEHVRRLSEVINIMLDAGAIIVATAIEFNQADIDLIKTTTACDRFYTIWMGKKKTTDIRTDICLEKKVNINDKLNQVISIIEKNST